MAKKATKKKASKKKAGSKPETNKGGRPEIEFDAKTWETLEALVKIQCTAEECASVLKCSEDTIDRRLNEKYGFGFAEYRKRFAAEGRVSLRRLQWKKAQTGDRVMLIWLGKQVLGQRDVQQLQGPGGTPMFPDRIEICDAGGNNADRED